MVIPSAIQVFGGVSDVEHLVKDYILNHKTRNFRRIERAADRNMVMSSIVMPKDPVCFFSRPGQNRFGNSIAKIFSIN